MILWTIQNVEAYNRLMQNGVLHADENHLFCEDDFRHAYDWMSSKLSELDTKPTGVNYPIWAWYQWEGKRKKRDLRNRGFGLKGEYMVQMEIEIPDEKVLLSDFDVFHVVLNRSYLCGDEESYDEFEEHCMKLGIKYEDLIDKSNTTEEINKVRKMIIDSWDGIFDLTAEDDNWLYGKNEDKSIQAVFWELKKDQVNWVRHFTAR